MNDHYLPLLVSTSQDLIDQVTLAQQLQSEKDGIRRPAPGSATVAAGEEPDALAQQVQRACVYTRLADRLLAMQSSLASLGQRMEAQGALNARVGEDYAAAVLTWLEQAFPADRAEGEVP